MKKLLSICFLSILLGLMSFSTQAQCNGFWIENLQPDVLSGVANCGNTTGTYALDHTLGHAVLMGESNRYVGNVGASALEQTELYELHFCGCPGKKVSLDWMLYRRNPQTNAWELVNENLSAYADFSIYTLYPQINSTTGQCQSIQWLGGQVPNGFGVCDYDPNAVPSLLDTILGLPACNTPTNYPGAMQSQAGTLPGSVVNVLGETTASIGMTPIYSQGFDYFYSDFLASTRTIVTIKWHQVGDYKLVMNVRERIGGTDWNNTPLNGENTSIGGHQACCGPVLISDTLHYPVLDTLTMEVCEGTTTEMGSPMTFTFGNPARSILDTIVLIGERYNDNTNCEYIDIDTLRDVNYLVRMLPIAQIEKPNDTLCKCDELTTAMVRAMVEFDSTEIATFVTGDETVEYKLQWYHWCTDADLVPQVLANGDTVFDIVGIDSTQIINQGHNYKWTDVNNEQHNADGYEYISGGTDYYYYHYARVYAPHMVCPNGYSWYETIDWNSWVRNPETNDTTYVYFVRQVNTYSNYGDTVVCEGPAVPLYITFREITAPVLSDDVELCYNERLNADSTAATITVTAEHDSICANTTKWYTGIADTTSPLKSEFLIDSTLVFTGDELVIDLTAYAPKTNHDTVVKFYAISVDTEKGCKSTKVSVFTLTYHQNPELAATVTPDSLICPNTEVAMQVTITNNDVNPDFTYFWDGTDTVNNTKVVTIGNGTSTSSSYPAYVYRKYSYSQQIFNKDEVPSGMIQKIGFNASSINDTIRKIAIYLSVTDKDNFYDKVWDVNNNKVLVFTDSVAYTKGWNEFELTTPFVYDTAQGNLLLTFVDLTGDSIKKNNSFYTTVVTGNNPIDGNYKTLYTYGSNQPYVVNGTFTTTASRSNYRNNVRFTVESPRVEQPVEINEDYAVTGTGSDYQIPVNGYYKYSYTEQIYTPNEVSNGNPGNITSLSFNYVGTNTMQKKTNVEIYLGTTTKSSFSDATDRVNAEGDFAGLTKVWAGDLKCTAAGWKEISFIAPFEYDGVSNLAVIVYDKSGTYDGKSYKFATNTATDKVLYYYADGSSVPNPQSFDNKKLGSIRSNIKFHFHADNPGYVTDNKSTNAYKKLTKNCDSVYTSTVQVVDDNNCWSNVVTFIYRTGDTIMPELTRSSYTEYVNTCEIDSLVAWYNVPQTVEEFNESGLAEVSDNCDSIAMTVTAVLNPAGDNCEASIVRTYAFTDACHPDTTVKFVHTIIGRDSVQPFFAIDRPMRLDPVIAPERNCTFNGPDTNTLLNMIAPYVVDNCTDSATLMSTIVFRWENTNLSPVNDENIFETQNHMTITAVITDKCGNVSDTTVVFFLDRPDTMSIGDPELLRNDICVSDYDSIYFDVTSIVDDTVSGPYNPYTLTWTEINNKPVIFSDVNSDSTRITFPEGGEYTIQMVVTNVAGCTAESRAITIRVRDLPQLSIEPIVLNGQTEPYCPTYGNLTVKAIVANPVEADPEYWTGSTFVWTGESVNEFSTTDSTWITIVPEECTSSYTAHVQFTDDWGCVGDAERTFQVAPHAMTFHGKLADSVVTLSDTCTLAVPSFKEMIVDTNIVDDCYTFGKIKYADAYGQVERIDTVTGLPTWYSQTPAAGTLFTGDSVVVTITITNPCGQTVNTTAIARKPANYPSVVLNQNFVERCYDAIVNPTGNPVIFELDEVNSINIDPLHSEFAWTVNVLPQDSIMSTTPVFALPTTLWNIKDTSDVYTITLDVINQNGCEASAAAILKVHYQGDEIQTTTWPNTMCERNNGVLAVHYIPNDYQVTVWGTNYGPVVKISDVPYHQTTPWNTIMFDSLHQGPYHVMVTDTFGCSKSTIVEIDALPDMSIDTPAIAVTDVTVCNDNNGAINITPENGYSFQLFFEQELVGTGTSYTGLHHGTYTVRKIKNSTLCYIDVDTTVAYDAVDILPGATFTNNTNCLNTVHGYDYNGTITLKGGQHMSYLVFQGNHETADTIYATTVLSVDSVITGLVPTSYYIKAFDTLSGCYGYQTITISNNAVDPEYVISSYPNNYCVNDEGLVNGHLTFSSSSYTYTVFGFESHNWYDTMNVNSLYAGQYLVEALNTTNGCRSFQLTHVNNALYYPYVNEIELTDNISCDPTVMPYNGAAEFTIVADLHNQMPFNNVIDTNEVYNSSYTLTIGKIADLSLICNDAEISAQNGSSYYTPVGDFHKNSHSEQIFTPDEVGAAGNISKISFNYQGYNTMTKKTNVKIYLGHTTKDEFANNSDWITSGLTLVYTGNLNCSTGWNEFELDNDFSYNGTDNLVVVVNDDSGQYGSSSNKFYYTNCTGNKCLTYTNDSNPWTNSKTGSRRTYRSDIRFTFCSENSGIYGFRDAVDTVIVSQNGVVKATLTTPTQTQSTNDTISNAVNVTLQSGVPATVTYKTDSTTAKHIYSKNFNFFTLTQNKNDIHTNIVSHPVITKKDAGSNYTTATFTPNDYQGHIAQSAAFPYISTPGGYTLTLTDHNSPEFTMTDHFTSGTAGFDTLYQGTYDYVITTPYKCSATGQVVVKYDPVDTMELVSTPNHMCAPTFEKPGDGTITVIRPVAHDGHTYAYSFLRNGMDVPYAQPMTETKYWLAAGQYTVFYVDNLTGCTGHTNITVEDSLYNVYFTTETTPSMYCDSLTGTGTMTVTIVNGLNSNPDGVYNYSLDGNTWQANPTFTGLASRVNAYTVFVKDITTGCQASGIFYINPSICQPVITIHDNSMPMRYSDFSYCINSDNVTLTGSANSECVDNFKYSWEAPCSEYYYSPDSTIAVDIDHVMANGCTYVFHVLDTVTHCSYSQPVLVTIYQRPNFQFLINNDPYPVNLDAGPIFCEQVPLTIATQAIPYNPTVSDATPTLVDTVWTLGHVGTEPFFQTSGLEFPDNDSPTFCVKVMDDHGCWSSVGSLPVNFNRIVRETQTVNACESYTVNNKTYTYAEKGHTTFTVNDTISSYGDCGKIITYNITLYKTPAVDFHFNEFMADQCTYPNILSDMKDSIAAHLTPMDGSTTIKLYINRGTDNVPAWTLLAQYPTVDYSYNDSTFKFVATNGVCQDWDTTFHLNFPNAVVDSFDLATYYCNGKSTTITVKASNYGHNNATITLPLPNGVTLIGTVYPGVNQYVPLAPAFTPWNATFNNQEVTLSISNGNCPANTYKKTFTVDTTYALHVTNDKTYCERDTIKLSDFTFTSGNSNVVFNYNDFKSVYAYDTVTGYLIFRYVYGATNNILTHVAQEADTNMALRFNVINNCDRPVAADTLGLVINPLPKLTVVTGDFNLCVAGAEETLNGRVLEVKHAENQGWMLRDESRFDADGNYLNETFTGNTMPAGWTNYGWTKSSSYVYSNVSASNSSDKWLFTPAIDLTVDATLSFDVQRYNTTSTTSIYNADDSLYVYVLPVNTLPETLPVAIDSFRISNNNWQTRTLNLSAYGDTVYVAFRNAYYASIPSNKTARLYLRNVKVTATNHDDIYNGPFTTQELIDTLKVVSSADVAYYAENGCGDTLATMGVYRIYDSVKITPHSVTVEVCPENTDLSYLKTQISYTVDYNHYLASQIDTIYKFDNDGILDSIIVRPNASAPAGADCTADTLIVNVDLLPSVVLEPDTLDICNFATFAEVKETIMNTQGTVVTPTDATLTWSLDGVALTDNYVFKMEDNGKKIKAVASTTECEHSFDTVVVRMVEIPVPQAKGDTIICANETATMSVVNPSSTSTYAWFVKGQTDTIGTGTSLTVAFSAAGTQVVNVLQPEYTATTEAGMFYEFTVVETNYNGCESTTMENVSVDMYDSTVITIKVTSDPQFIFTNTDNVRTHEFEAVTGTGLQYTWMIDDRCYDPDQLVYVEYDIYFKGENDDDYVLIQNEQIGQYLYTQTFADMNNFGNITSYVTSNTFSWYSGDCNTLLTNTSYYNFAVANPTSATAGNHFPNTNIGLTNTNVYDDLWMHFLAGRPVTKNFVPFRLHGDYKVVYRLYSTQHANDFGHLYCADDDHSDLSAPTVGGQNALVGNTMVQIAIDSINIHVTGEDNPLTINNDVAPELAPSISTEENVVAPEMEVWPNPAPSIVTTFKARVHNMSGDATVTITNFTGKQVYSGNMFIDSDNFYFEADVNSLAVGAYIMTVRTKDAVVTKKLVVTVRQ